MLTKAYVNHGRWLIDCPECRAGWLVRRENPLVIYDAKGNPHARCACGAKISGVQFPREMEEIDAALALRGNEANRNWRPGESVADLRIENAAHGV